MFNYSWFIDTDNGRVNFIDLQSAKAYADMHNISRSSLSFTATSNVPIAYNLSNPVTSDTGISCIDSQSGDF